MAKWSPGRQGDLRDVWRVAAEGPINANGEWESSKRGKMMTLRGREEVERDWGDVTQDINAVGAWVKGRKEGASVAVCLSNSVELMVCVFGEFRQAIALSHVVLSDTWISEQVRRMMDANEI